MSFFTRIIKITVQFVCTGTEVLRVLASDPDEGDNAAIEYSIENATFSVFTIDKNSGAIYTTDYLDRENIDEYKFNVQAVDGGKLFIYILCLLLLNLFTFQQWQILKKLKK